MFPSIASFSHPSFHRLRRVAGHLNGQQPLSSRLENLPTPRRFFLPLLGCRKTLIESIGQIRSFNEFLRTLCLAGAEAPISVQRAPSASTQPHPILELYRTQPTVEMTLKPLCLDHFPSDSCPLFSPVSLSRLLPRA